MQIIDYGLSHYQDILNLQFELFHRIIEEKRMSGEGKEEFLLLGEHHPVITLGSHAKFSNILTSAERLQKLGVEVFETERGGDVTFHGPGQLVAYPILDLQAHKLGVKNYVNLLEESVIRLLKEYGLNGERIEGATGVWLRGDETGDRKICAIGVKCSRFCTMHGLALNVNTDLKGFSLINPCGFTDKGVTSMKKECGEALDFQEVKKRFSDIFLSLIFSL